MSFYKLRSLIKLNLKLLFDYEFLRDGNYTNVASGAQFYDGSVMSLLQPDTDAINYYSNYSQPGQIWQSAFRNWVYESGVVLNDSPGVSNLTVPTRASGVYVYGTFRPSSPNHPDYDASFAHKIDFINGRIFFENPIATNAEVHADFSYKHIRIDFEDAFNRQRRDGYLESKYTTNPLTSHQLIYPSGTAQPFPAIFIEADSRSWEGYELGNRSLIAHDLVRCHVWTLDSMSRDNILDTLSYEMRKQIPLIDFNLAPLPLSGIFNEISPAYLAYQVMLTNPRVPYPGVPGSTVPTIGFTMTIDRADPSNIPPAMTESDSFERGLVQFETGIYGIAPISQIGINLGAFQFRGGTEDV